jgi:hypothetical protein
LGGGDDLLGDGLRQRTQQPLLMGWGVQVDGVLARQEVVHIQVVALGPRGDLLVLVDVQHLLGRRIQGVSGPVGAPL